MTEMKAYRLGDGKYVWTNSLEAFKGTIFWERIIAYNVIK
jgi:hypothetical protein